MKFLHLQLTLIYKLKSIQLLKYLQTNKKYSCNF